MCYFENDVPPNYFSNINEFGQRLDRNSRPELLYGTYDIKAPSGFKKREANKPTYVVLIDVSLQSFDTGYFHQCLTSLQQTLDYLPYPEQTSICVATFDSRIQFYQMPEDENAEPQIIIVSDIDDPFIPLPLEKLLMNMDTDRDRFLALLDKLYNMYSTEHY